jgi:diguanylate cyclase (GGDEF)-like protein
MHGFLWDVSPDVRAEVARAIRDHDASLVEDFAAAVADTHGLSSDGWRECGSTLFTLFAGTIEQGELDPRRGAIRDLSRFSPPATVLQIMRSIHTAERVIHGNLAADETVGTGSEGWPSAGRAVRAAAFEIAAAFAERGGGGPAVRDSLTTLMSPAVFRLALTQELARAHRHQHGTALLLFDLDNLADVNSAHGYGAGDRLIERLGILACKFFRNHDWVARHDEDSVVVLLPEATFDQAAMLADHFRDMVSQRLVLTDHKTDAETRITVSAAALGTDLLEGDIEAGHLISELEAAVLRAKLAGGNRTECAALLPPRNPQSEI